MNDNKLQNIENKLDAVVEKLYEMNVILAKNTESLIIHEKRTDLAEKKIETLNERIDEIKDRENEQFRELSELVQTKVNSIHEKIAPIKNHVEVLDNTFKFIWKFVVPSIVGVFAILYKFGYLKF